VIAFALPADFAAALVAGLLPALSTTGKTMLKALQTSARTGASSVSRTALRKSLLTAEIAITVVLLVAAGLLLKSFSGGCAHPMWDALPKTCSRCSTACRKRNTTRREKVNAFNEALLEAGEKHSRVRAAALETLFLQRDIGETSYSRVKEHPPLKPGDDPPDALMRWVIQVISAPRDSALNWPVLYQRRTWCSIVQGDCERQLVRRYFPGDNPLGKHLRVPAHFHVGVPMTSIMKSWASSATPCTRSARSRRRAMYFPILEGDGNSQMLAVRTASEPLQFAE